MLSETFSLKCSGGMEIPGKEEEGGDVKIWFCGLFSNIGSTPRSIPWHQSYPRECFPCQHTSVSVAELSVSCGFWSGHPGSGMVLL